MNSESRSQTYWSYYNVCDKLKAAAIARSIHYHSNK